MTPESFIVAVGDLLESCHQLAAAVVIDSSNSRERSKRKINSIITERRKRLALTSDASTRGSRRAHKVSELG